MFNLGNLAGTIMFRQIPLVSFAYKNGKLMNAQLLNYDKAILPFEFMNFRCDELTVTQFFAERITPDTRQGLQKYLDKAGIGYYDPEAIIRYQNGRCIHDKYWVKFD